ncbi:hypothetical protein TRFO_01073 [Tritrichomonas foetus]|uniref:Uncharacterized protein n=1 Tax=Tritrichomonas foetus TaxID=1144522 RepID=A0A1J4KJB5_9EUKA|nr:hypothetical protein TRFO_01073 [Tritrichomonas foetus]|eukprot:OHT11170.1 hypothetical protein TRFO_01073 [Tritrichomonas foetus]
MRRFPSLHLSNEENNIIASILDEEESELKDTNFYTQSNISNLDSQIDQNLPKIDQNFPKYEFMPNIKQNFNYSDIKTEPNNIHDKTPINYFEASDYSTHGVQRDRYASMSNENPSTANLRHFDINSLKTEVDDLMEHVRSAVRTGKSPNAVKSSEVPKVNHSVHFQQQQQQHESTSEFSKSSFENHFLKPYGLKAQGSNDSNTNPSNSPNYSTSQSSFAFQSSKPATQQMNSNFDNLNMNFDNNYINQSSPSSRLNLSNHSNQYQIPNPKTNYSSYNNDVSYDVGEINFSKPHVEFPDFTNNKPRNSPLNHFSRNRQSPPKREIEDPNKPFSLPQPIFPEEPQVFTKGTYRKRNDTSKEDGAELKDLRKENLMLKAELLKIEKRLQLEEEENKKLLSSLQKSKKLRDMYQSKIEQKK